MDSETNQEIQSDELEALQVRIYRLSFISLRRYFHPMVVETDICSVALQGIFFDQFINCNGESSEWKPLNVILTVVPQRDQSGPLEAHVQLNLHVIATEDYPNV